MVNCENMRGEATVPAKHAGGTIKGACENVGDLDRTVQKKMSMLSVSSYLENKNSFAISCLYESL